ncbi:MAG: hypothetical protein M0R80_09015 [Proteobacteria bacterium]|jgi:hypothetical protein|nr:hypothetical protein [Pseudomonadota bacterium]
MFASRIWTLLLALLGGALIAIVLLATDLVNRERLENSTALLYKESDKVEIALTLHARKRLDVLLGATADEDVRKMLAEVSANPDKAASVRDKLLKVLLERNAAFGKYKADLLIALDAKGTVVGQIGTNPHAKGYNLAGFPAVDGALRGYIRDDVWKLDNDVMLVAARPVVQGGRYVGALVHALLVNDKLAAELSPKVLLAFFAGNTIIAAGSPEGKPLTSPQRALIAEQLEKVLVDKTFREKGYSEVSRVQSKTEDFMTAYALVHGEAAANDVGYLLLTPVSLMAKPTEFYEKAGVQDIDKLPRELLIGGIVLVVLLGWLWNYLEAERPVGKLHKAVMALETADPKDQLNIYKFSRRIRKTAISFNKVADLKVKAAFESAAGAGKSIDSILGKASEGPRLSSASFKFVEASADDIPDAPPPPSAGAPRPASGPQAAIAPPRPIAGAPPPPASGSPGTRPPVPPPPAPPAPQGGPPALSPEEEQAYFRKIHGEFVALKQKLGEPVDQLTFERFEVTLKKNRDALVARYGCKVVQFQVYEKDGKASLKATPVK